MILLILGGAVVISATLSLLLARYISGSGDNDAYKDGGNVDDEPGE